MSTTPNDLPRHLAPLTANESRLLHYRIERRLNGLTKRTRDMTDDTILLLHQHLDRFTEEAREEFRNRKASKEGDQ